MIFLKRYLVMRIIVWNVAILFLVQTIHMTVAILCRNMIAIL